MHTSDMRRRLFHYKSCSQLTARLQSWARNRKHLRKIVHRNWKHEFVKSIFVKFLLSTPNNFVHILQIALTQLLYHEVVKQRNLMVSIVWKLTCSPLHPIRHNTENLNESATWILKWNLELMITCHNITQPTSWLTLKTYTFGHYKYFHCFIPWRFGLWSLDGFTHKFERTTAKNIMNHKHNYYLEARKNLHYEDENLLIIMQWFHVWYTRRVQNNRRPC